MPIKLIHFTEELIEQLVEQAEQLEGGQGSSGEEEGSGGEAVTESEEPKKIVNKVSYTHSGIADTLE